MEFEASKQILNNEQFSSKDLWFHLVLPEAPK